MGLLHADIMQSLCKMRYCETLVICLKTKRITVDADLVLESTHYKLRDGTLKDLGVYWAGRI